MLGEIGSTERDMKHRIFRPFRLKLVYGKSFEQVFLSLEIRFQSRYEQALPEPPWTAQEVNLSFFNELVHQVRLVNIHISVLDNFVKSTKKILILLRYSPNYE